jgi:mannose-6-phosphate isomerase-like protein (cupin superfamily)
MAIDELPGMEVVYVWATEGTPTVPNTGNDRTHLDQDFFPGQAGSRFVVITYPPGFGAAPAGPDTATTTGITSTASLDQLLMHATETVDYAVVLEGEMTLILDSGEEVVLRPHDTVVQNGTVHGWRNGSDKTAVLAFFMLGAQSGESSAEGAEAGL